jgi:hypothetical protein
MVQTVLRVLLTITGALNICMAQTASSTPIRAAFVEPKSIFKSIPVYSGYGRGWSQEPKFQVKYSEPLAVLNFINHLSSNAPDNSFIKLFTGSKFNQQKYQQLLAEFDRLNVDIER